MLNGFPAQPSSVQGGPGEPLVERQVFLNLVDDLVFQSDRGADTEQENAPSQDTNRPHRSTDSLSGKVSVNYSGAVTACTPGARIASIPADASTAGNPSTACTVNVLCGNDVVLINAEPAYTFKENAF